MNNSSSLFSNQSDMLKQLYQLYQLADKIDWGKFETAFQPLYC
jgi:IS5 family transposase